MRKEEVEKILKDAVFMKRNLAGDKIYYSEKRGYIAVTKLCNDEYDVDFLGC